MGPLYEKDYFGGWDEKKYFIWLTLVKGLGPVKQRSLIGRMGSPFNIYNSSSEDIENLGGVSSKMADAIAEDIRRGEGIEKAERILDNCERKDIDIVTMDDVRYPFEAASIKNMPVLVYSKGLLIPNSYGVAIVGARRCSDYAKRVACEAAAFLAKKSIPVISGMAKGVDSYAQTECIRKGGYTLAFLGGGVDVCYPKEHIRLYNEIMESGALVSEYPPGEKPFHKNFLRRNFLMSAWAKNVLVVQAGEKSGALTTARFALDIGRGLFSVPDRIYEESSRGSNELLAKGANIYTDKNQLLEGIIEAKYLQEKKEDCVKASKTNISGIKRKVLNIVKARPVGIDEIKLQLRGKYGKDEIESAIFELEMEMYIEQSGGKYKYK